MTTEAIEFIESTTPEQRWGNRAGRTHRGKWGGNLPELWSREVCLYFLRKHIENSEGPLPTSSSKSYAALTKGVNLPPAPKLIEHFKLIRFAWEEAGAPPKRLAHAYPPPWTQEEDDFIREHAGYLTRKQVARRLGRTEGAVKTRANKELGIFFRSQAGFYCAAQVAKELGVYEKRVYDFIDKGLLKAKRLPGVKNRYDIDPRDVTPEIVAELRSPKHRGPIIHYTNEQVDRIIAMRQGGATWKTIGLEFQIHPRTLWYRYEQAMVTKKPRWKAVWYVCKEFGGSCALIDVARILARRGHGKMRYSTLKIAVEGKPDRLRIDNGVVSVVHHTSKRIRPTAVNPYSPPKETA